jgi:hypothetical protein
MKLRRNNTIAADGTHYRPGQRVVVAKASLSDSLVA